MPGLKTTEFNSGKMRSGRNHPTAYPVKNLAVLYEGIIFNKESPDSAAMAAKRITIIAVIFQPEN
ncbi:MAG TPA: hypothetical protein VF347_05375 [Candidatus Humimicrobiaceae bacterium]